MRKFADIAQLEELSIRNRMVGGSNPPVGSMLWSLGRETDNSEAHKLNAQSYFAQSENFTKEQVAQNPSLTVTGSEMFPTVLSLNSSPREGSSLKAKSVYEIRHPWASKR